MSVKMLGLSQIKYLSSKFLEKDDQGNEDKAENGEYTVKKGG